MHAPEARNEGARHVFDLGDEYESVLLEPTRAPPTRGLLNIDRTMERIAPPSAEVTLSYPNWPDYTAIDITLAEKQGMERTKLQKDSTSSIRCWREMVEVEPLSEFGGTPSFFTLIQ